MAIVIGLLTLLTMDSQVALGADLSNPLQAPSGVAPRVDPTGQVSGRQRLERDTTAAAPLAARELQGGLGLPVARPPAGPPPAVGSLPAVPPASVARDTTSVWHASLARPAAPGSSSMPGSSGPTRRTAANPDPATGSDGATVNASTDTVGTATATDQGPPGVWALDGAGGIANLGGAPWYGSPLDSLGYSPTTVTALATDTAGTGYWVLGADGSVWNEGAAPWWGSPLHANGGQPTPTPEVALAAASQGEGYWVLGANGSVDQFGQVGWYGSPRATAGWSSPISSPGVGLAATPAGNGYWVLLANGAVDNFGGASWYGSPRATAGWGTPLPAPAVAIAATPQGNGYWVLLANGTLDAYGTANPVPGVPATPAPSALAASPLGSLLPPGKTGYDVSFPQCSSWGAPTAGPLPSSGTEFAIVGANWGGTFSMNTCVAAEVAWAGQPMDYYFNLDQPWWYDPAMGDNGPAGTCSDPTNTSSTCVAYNYGWNATQWTLRQLASQNLSVPGIWLDIETVGSCGTSGYWSCDTAVNANVIAGAIAAAHAEGIAIGIYSTGYQWGVIAGSYDPSVPEWIPGAGTLANAQSFCPAAAGENFASGPIAAIQYGYIDGGPNPFDPDWSCPAPLG